MNFYPIITASLVKTTLPEINNNIPDGLITNAIQIVQKMNIRPLLGYGYYEELMLEASGGTHSTANQFILDEYLYMIIALYVQSRLVLSNSYQLENNGLRIKLSDVSDIAETKDMVLYRSSLKNDIDFLVNEMIKYIEDNKNDYPLYFDRTGKLNTANESRRKYDYGFSLGKVENDCFKLI